MGKNKKRQERNEPRPEAATAAAGSAGDAVPAAAMAPATEAPAPASPVSAAPPAAAAPSAPLRSTGRVRRWLPDLIKTALALVVVGVGGVIWYKPPLTVADFPHVSYRYQNQLFTDAQLFRPLAMPTRYYIRLPRKLADRYEWFAVDRRREVAAITSAPHQRLLGHDAIKRSDPLGLDLEFRKLDHSEWQVHFLPDAIVFSNALLSVRLDTKPPEPTAR